MILLAVAMLFQVLRIVDAVKQQARFSGFELEGWIVATTCFVVAGAMFVVEIAILGTRHRTLYIGCLLWVLSMVVFSGAVLPVIAKHFEQNHVVATRLALLDLVSQIETMNTRAGRLPSDESELVKLRGRPMPVSGWQTPIKYYKEPNEAAYRVTCYSTRYSKMCFDYDSRSPDKGVVVEASRMD